MTDKNPKPSEQRVFIERVKLARSETPPNPDKRKVIERLLIKWLVRAYLKQYENRRSRAEGVA